MASVLDTFQPVERRFDSTTDRLFLVYYPITPGFNGNKWGVTEDSIERNVHTAVNKPVVIYKKNPDNPLHAKQAGTYIHPTPEEASAELGKVNAQSYYNWQEKFAVGRVRSVDKRDKGYAFTLEITDPEAKNILKSDAYGNGIPGYTSPQIISNAALYPEEAQQELYSHWTISHIALLDVPAYGREQSGVRAKCLGAEQECMITTRSASQENIGFCVKQAVTDLIHSRSAGSSQSAQSDVSSHTIMSQQENTNGQTAQPVKTNSETVTFSGVTGEQPNPLATSVNAETKEEVAQKQTEQDRAQSPGQEEPNRLSSDAPKTLQEAQIMIQQMSELVKEQGKQLKTQGKELETIKTERKQARLAFIIPRDLFKSDESHSKEVQKAMNENVPESFLIEYWKTKRELANAPTRRMEEPLVAKSASLQQQGREVPDFSSSQNSNQSDNIKKTLELQRRILEGGV